MSRNLGDLAQEFLAAEDDHNVVYLCWDGRTFSPEVNAANTRLTAARSALKAAIADPVEAGEIIRLQHKLNEERDAHALCRKQLIQLEILFGEMKKRAELAEGLAYKYK